MKAGKGSILIVGCISALGFLALAAPAFAQSATDARLARLEQIKRELAKCANADCPERPLLQARLNYVLKMDKMIRDFEGTMIRGVSGGIRGPGGATDLQSLRAAIVTGLKNQPPVPDSVYNVSENSAKAAIVNYCRAMNDLQTLGPYLTNDEQMDVSAGAEETKAKIEKCIPEYDASAIPANRKAAIEYCLKNNNYLATGTTAAAYSVCMNQNDMLTAFCTQNMRLRWAYATRSSPRPGPPPSCSAPLPNRGEVPAILSATVGAAPGLPAKLLAPPPPVSNPAAAPPVVIPEGTVLQVSVASPINAANVNIPGILSAWLEQPVQAGGKVLLRARAIVMLKARVLGPGPLPNSVRIAVAADYVTVNDQRVAFTSSEVVQTVLDKPSGPRSPEVPYGVPANTKLSFTVGSAPR
jgi:hypothetical protein